MYFLTLNFEPLIASIQIFIMKQNEWQDLFDDDPIENLKIKNEILKLKMQAEHGAFFFTDDEVPPEIESLFLHNVSEFEKAWQHAKLVKIFDIIGQPVLPDPKQIEPSQLDETIESVLDLLNDKNITIEKPAAVEPREFYRFLIEELFIQEIEDIKVEGFFRGFDYYEFHPDHKQEIRAITERFIDNWFRKNTEGLKWDLCSEIILKNKNQLVSIEDVMILVNRYFDSITLLTAGHFQIRNIQFDSKMETDHLTGQAEGLIYYEMESDYMHSKKVGGPFRIYLNDEYGYWNIEYFDIPGFEWD